MFLSAVGHYDEDNHIVRGTQFYEIYRSDGVMSQKISLDTQFYIHEVNAFKDLVESEGFRVLNVYGDYSHGPFDKDKSPFMIWVLEGNDSLNKSV